MGRVLARALSAVDLEKYFREFPTTKEKEWDGIYEFYVRPMKTFKRKPLRDVVDCRIAPRLT